MSVYSRLMQGSIAGLTRVACVLALLALGLISCSVLFPQPLPVILAMSLGHAVGGAAFACYLLAVILDATRRSPPPALTAANGTVGARTSDDETLEVVVPRAEPARPDGAI
jgi:hypothetical protein